MNIKKITIITLVFSLTVIIFTMVAYIVNGYFNPFEIHNLSTERLGNFGDFIGGFIGVILTFLATLIIYLTYNSQRKELEINRKLFKDQLFDNTFFNMLKVHQEIKYNISCDFTNNKIAQITGSPQQILNSGFYYDKTLKGKEFFIGLNKLFKNFWKFDGNKLFRIKSNIVKEHLNYKYTYSPLDVIESPCKIIKDIHFKYNLFWKYFSDYLGDYLRNIYHILDYISLEKSKELILSKNDNEKNVIIIKYKKYADILQSQMSFSELFIIFYNSIKFRKMRKLVKEFNFLENLNTSNLIIESHSKINALGIIKSN